MENYNKKSFWKWILLYVVIGAIAYGAIYYFFFYNKGGFSYTPQNNQTQNQAQNNETATYIKVTSPKGGEIYRVGQDFIIIWQAQGVDNVYITVVSDDENLPVDSYYKSGECRLTFEPIPASQGSYLVKGGGQSKCGMLPAGQKLKVRITDQNSLTVGLSDNYFSIVK